MQFSERERRFAAYVLAGRQAPVALVDRARSVLGTFTVERQLSISASFTQLPTGWHQFPELRGTVALSWNNGPDSGGWANSMPLNAIAVQVWILPRKTPRYPPLKLVMPQRPATTLEGAPDTPEYRIRGRISGRDVEIWVDIRRPQPTQKLLRLAQRAVSAIRFT